MKRFAFLMIVTLFSTLSFAQVLFLKSFKLL